jgi:hypothetical protein
VGQGGGEEIGGIIELYLMVFLKHSSIIIFEGTWQSKNNK